MADLGGDVAGVQDLLLRVGMLVDAVPEISAMRLNPVLVSPTGAWALDVRIHVGPAAPHPDAVPLRRL